MKTRFHPALAPCFCQRAPANRKQVSMSAYSVPSPFAQASLPVHNQVLPSIESVDGSDPLATLQTPLGRLEAKEEEDEDEDEDTEEDEEEDGEDTDLDDWEPDPPRPFDPHDLCKCGHWTPPGKLCPSCVCVCLCLPVGVCVNVAPVNQVLPCAASVPHSLLASSHLAFTAAL